MQKSIYFYCLLCYNVQKYQRGKAMQGNKQLQTAWKRIPFAIIANTIITTRRNC